MGGPEGPGRQQGAVLGGQAHHRVDLRGLQGLRPGHGGQDGGQPLGRHALARPRRAHQQHVVASGGGDLQHPLHLLLAPDLVEVRQGLGGDLPSPGRGGGDGGPAGEMVRKLGHGLHGVDRQPPGQGGLRGGGRRDEEGPDPRPLRRQGHGEHPHHGAQGAGKGELPHKGAGLVLPDELPVGGQDAHQNGQVVDRARFPQVGRGQVHGDPPHGEGEAAVPGGGPDPLPGLLHRRVRQAHDIEVGQAGGEVALGGDLIPRQTLEPQGTDLLQHGGASFRVGIFFYLALWHKRPPGATGTGEKSPSAPGAKGDGGRESPQDRGSSFFFSFCSLP